MTRTLLSLLRDEDGPTAVEYAVVFALIVGVCISSVNLLASQTGASFDNSASQLAGVLGS